MSPAVKRGLQVAKDHLRRAAKSHPYGSLHRGDMFDAIEWIAHQEAIDERRRKRSPVVPW